MALSEHWLTRITAWQSSGLSQAAYCRQHQLTYPTFSARLCEFRAQATLSPLAPSFRVARQCLCIVAGGVIALSGLVAAPAQIGLAVAPVDMRRGIDGLSTIVQ